jgi:HTH-type transcriptional regulator / antitoxin HigA
VITNERQYTISKAQAERFRQTLTTPAAGLHPRAAKAMREGLESQLNDLEQEIADYEALRSGTVTTIAAESLTELPVALVKARIIRNLTQKDLGERMGLPEQQIQRYEATLYKGVALERLQEVADALQIRVQEVITIESA